MPTLRSKRTFGFTTAIAVVFTALVFGAASGQVDAPSRPKAQGSAAQEAPKPPTAAEPPRVLRCAADPEGRARVERALAGPVKLHFVGASLATLVAHIREHHKIGVVVDRKALDGLGITLGTPITISLEGVSLRSALNLILSQHELSYVFDDGLLTITSKSVADTILHTAVYDVGDLLYVEGADEPDYDSLIELIQWTIAPGFWGNGGPGSMAPLLDRLVVAATDDVHEQVGGLLSDLRAARKQMETEKGDARYAPIIGMSPAEARILEKLKERIDLDVDNEPLSKFAESLSKRLGVPIVFDQKALDDVGVSEATPITGSFSGVTVRTALNYILAEFELSWVIEDEALIITSKTVSSEKLLTRVYPVGDLLGEDDDDYETLSNAIQMTVAPQSWDERAPGSIMEFEPTKCLVFSNTHNVHEQVADLLTTLRKSRALVPPERRPARPHLRVYRLPAAAPGEARPSSEDLKKLLLEFVDPAGWKENGAGGLGEIRALPGALLIRHTRKGHEAALDLLGKFEVWDATMPWAMGLGGFGGGSQPAAGTAPAKGSP
ncbi:MAG: STN domain-containing protein [Planctomycetia bacterium]|nr:STN domain-containing protein [Planctomycetia bacterium]